jgi:hypothetical protein
MREVWLRPNRRAIWFGCLPPLAIAALGAWLVAALPGESDRVGRWLGVALFVAGLTLAAALFAQLLRPRVAYGEGQVLFYLRSGPPIAVPVGVIEAFFVGRGRVPLPGLFNKQETMNLVARISQRATEWACQDVKQSLGNWCDGYVTIRGLWCEPLEADLIRRLNRRLAEVKSGLEQ